jgi:hypothetical protein
MLELKDVRYIYFETGFEYSSHIHSFMALCGAIVANERRLLPRYKGINATSSLEAP